MTDPVEQWARKLAEDSVKAGEAEYGKPGADGPIKRFAETLRSAWRVEDNAEFMAQRTIEDYRAWLREQGIPIEKLLSGEMVATLSPERQAEEFVKEYANQRKDWPPEIGPDGKAIEDTDAADRALEKLERKLAQAELGPGVREP